MAKTLEELASQLTSDPEFSALSQQEQDQVFAQLAKDIESPGTTPIQQEPSVGIAGKVPLSQYQAGERNVMGNLFERPTAAIRGGLQGLAPGGPNPAEGYVQGARNPGTIPSFQDVFIDRYYQDVARRDPGQNPSIPQVLGGMVPSAAGLALDTVTNPAELLASIITAGATKALAPTRVGQAVGRFMTAERPWPLQRGPKPQNLSELVQIPSEQVAQLSPKDQKTWFSIQQSQQLQALKRKSLQLKAERKAINRELGKAATQRSLAIREQLPTLYSKQQQHFHELLEIDMAGRENTPVLEDKLRQFLMRRYDKDPERLTGVSARLGLGNQPQAQVIKQSGLVDEFGRAITTVEQLPPPTRTFGQMYQQAKDFGQSLPSAVRQSLRTYSADEELTDESIGTLIDFMKEQGVDLKNSRSFWAEWKPIQQQATQEFRPYNRVETRTQAASSRLKKLALGIDDDNENYAKTLANYLQMDDLPGELKQIVAKLSTNEKSLLATRLEQEAVKSPTGPLAQLQYVAGKRHEASLEKWQRVKWILGLITGGSVVAGGIKAIQRAP